MIWSSTAVMIVFDLIIVGLIVMMVGVSWSLGAFDKGRMPRTGRILIILGVIVTGVFYLADLLVMLSPSLLTDRSRAMALMTTLHLELRWIVSLTSLLLIGAGLIANAIYRRRYEKHIQHTEQRIAAAQDRIVESEIRFRALVEQTPDSVYCFEFDPPVPIDQSIEDQIAKTYEARLVECNQVFATVIEAASPAAAIGTRLGELDSSKDTDSHTRFFRDFIEQGYRLVDYELKYQEPQGEYRALQISLSGVIRNDMLVRMWGAEKDILEQHRTKAALAGRLHFQQFIAETSTRLLTASDNDAEQALIQCLEQVGRYVRADRATIIWFDQDKRTVDPRYYWNKRGNIIWDKLTLDDFPWIWPKILHGEPISIGRIGELAIVSRIDARSMEELGTKSIAIVPMAVAGEVHGACSFSNFFVDREWDTQDMTDLRVLVNLFANEVVRIDAHKALQNVTAELREARDRLEAENTYLREEISTTHGFDELIGESDGLMKCLGQVEKVAATTTAVLLQGETGTGKELIARAIHERSERNDRPLVKVNCAALPAELIESELFGHEKGAFTGASSRKPGRFDLADGGTLFLDEVADLPLELQSKLLRVLQEGEFQRVGGTQTFTVDVRLIAATNRRLQDAVDNGQFRADLYYRINTFPISLPALRDRDGDVSLLAEHFVQKHAPRLGKEITAISASMMEQLQGYSWPGNVRELEGIVQRALISSSGPVLQLAEPLQNGVRVTESA